VRADEGNLIISERRQIYGPNCVNRVRRIEYGDELCSICKEPSAVKMLKIARLK
jgi:hypothetical protein